MRHTSDNSTTIVNHWYYWTVDITSENKITVRPNERTHNTKAYLQRSWEVYFDSVSRYSIFLLIEYEVWKSLSNMIHRCRRRDYRSYSYLLLTVFFVDHISIYIFDTLFAKITNEIDSCVIFTNRNRRHVLYSILLLMNSNKYREIFHKIQSRLRTSIVTFIRSKSIIWHCLRVKTIDSSDTNDISSWMNYKIFLNNVLHPDPHNL